MLMRQFIARSMLSVFPIKTDGEYIPYPIFLNHLEFRILFRRFTESLYLFCVHIRYLEDG